MCKFASLIKIFCAVTILTACSSSTKINNNQVPIKHRAIINTNNAHTNILNAIKKDSINLQNQDIDQTQSIYFDYDNYNIKDEFYSIIEAHAKYLISHKKNQVIIQGNTDDRGSTEYNLALGQKRAEAVCKVLILLGVSKSQVEAVSFGEEKPKTLGNNEIARAKNRRADFYYQ